MVSTKDAFEQPKRVVLEIRTSRTGEQTPESTVQFLSSLTDLRFRHFLFLKKGIPISLEIGVVDQQIRFFLVVPPDYQAFIESQLIAQYPKALISRVKDYLPALLEKKETLSITQLVSHHPSLPIKTFDTFKDVDPLSSVLGILSKSQPGDQAVIQYLLYPIGNAWQRAGERAANSKSTDSTGAAIPNPKAKEILEKVAFAGFRTAIRIAVNGPTKERSNHFLIEIAHSYSSYNNPSGNSLHMKRPYLWQKQRFLKHMLERSRYFTPTHQIFNVRELASMYHYPGMQLATIPNIAWHKVILTDAPENLPVAEFMTDEQKAEVNFFGRTEFKNRQMVFGIKKKDRRRHFYVIGKTGTGKSTFIANMAINDMRNREGFCIIDPHGDLCETVLDYVPSYRVNDIIYLDPSDTQNAFSLNPLEVSNPEQKELVVSGIVAIFNKLYGTSWGPRLEYILRNTLASVIEMPDATLLMVPEMLANATFRKKVVSRLTNPVLKSFWENEFDRYTDKLRAEAVSPIQNKVGQFVASTVIRNIIKNPKSTLDLQKVMDEGKILLLNLSQGKLGEDNAALLGAMIITKLQLAAMGRAFIEEDQRRDFYLYVDEFQNFATSSFIKILSEARKYRLNLILANQYMGQIEEGVRLAIFGNCGTIMTFLVGAGDSPYLAKEFVERFKEEDVLALGNYQGILKMMIDGMTSSPFMCYTLPLPRSVTQNREKVIRMTRERYMKPVEEMTLAEAATIHTLPGQQSATSQQRDAKIDHRKDEGRQTTPSAKLEKERTERQQEKPQTILPSQNQSKQHNKPRMQQHGQKQAEQERVREIIHDLTDDTVTSMPVETKPQNKAHAQGDVQHQGHASHGQHHSGKKEQKKHHHDRPHSQGAHSKHILQDKVAKQEGAAHTPKPLSEGDIFEAK